MLIGETFNESVEMLDTLTGRPLRRMMRTGLYNEIPTYHLNACFSADSRYMIFGSAREGGSALLRGEVATGQLTVVALTDGIGSGSALGEPGALGPFVAGTLGGGFEGNHLCMLQATNWAVACLGRSLRAYHLESFEERVLMADVGAEYRFGNPIGAVDGQSVIVPRTPAHPDMVAGKRRTSRTYFEALAAELGGMPTTYLQVEIATGRVREVFAEPVAGSNHVQPCPAGPAVWLIDRDFPPLFSHGSDKGQTSRAWLLDTRTKGLTEIRPRFRDRFQIHTNWSRDGERVYYHGADLETRRRGAPAEHYVGVADRAGRIIWEGHFPLFHYGHVGTHTAADAILTDGLFTPDLLTAIHYEDLSPAGAPRLEILGRHGTVWDALRGQYSHPHPHMSPDGKWLCYNRGELGRSDVYVMAV